MKPLDDELRTILSWNYIESEAVQLTSSQTIWISREAMDSYRISGSKNPQQSFVHEYGYCMPDSTCFPSGCKNQSRRRVIHIERYGGAGLGSNGGGGRAAIINDVSIKGLGANCLVGEKEQHDRAYGGLDAPMAVIEIIYSQLFNRLLPVGAIKPIGLIYSGDKTALDRDGSKCWGVLLIREACLRPAHLLRAGHFNPPKSFTDNYRSDVARTRYINKSTKALLGGDISFVGRVGQFLSNSANQFAFARLARVMHGALSPSNISLDGRWLDLPLSSLVKSGTNYTKTSSFYEEYTYPLAIASEMLETYSKYNNVDLSFTPLENYYHDQFNAYLNLHLCYVLGLSRQYFNAYGSTPEWALIRDTIHCIILNGKTREFAWAEPHEQDPLATFFEIVFLAESNGAEAEQRIDYLISWLPISVEPVSILKAFKKISTHPNQNSDISPYHRHLQIVKVFKRIQCAKFFYLKNIDSVTRKTCATKTPEDLGLLIDYCDKQVKWIFDVEEDNEVTVYSDQSIQIKLCSVSGYTIGRNNGDTVNERGIQSTFNDIQSLLKKEIAALEGHTLIYKDYLETLVSQFELLEPE